MTCISDIINNLVKKGIDPEEAAIEANAILEGICDGLIKNGEVFADGLKFFASYNKKRDDVMVVVKYGHNYYKLNFPRRLNDRILLHYRSLGIF